MAEHDGATRLPVPRAEFGALVRPTPTGFAALNAAISPVTSYLDLARRRKWTLLVAAAVVFGATCVVTLASPRIYEATATLLVSEPAAGSAPGAENADQLQVMMGAIAAPDIETHATLIQGKSTAAATAAWLQEHGGPKLSASQVGGAIQADIVPKTRLVRLRARARSSEAARQIANATASAYVELNRHRAQGSSESASQYLTEQLGIAKGNLDRSEEALRAFKESTGAIAPDASAGDLLARAASLRGDIDKTNADLAQTRERLGEVRKQLGRQDKSIQAARLRDNAVVQQLRAKLVDLEGQRLLLQSQYTDAFSAPVKQVEEQIRITRDQLHAEILTIVGSGGDLAMQQTLVGQLIQGEAELAALGARERQLQAELTGTQGELDKMPARQITLTRLQRQVEVAQGIYSDLLKRAQEMQVGRVMALGNTDVVELADTPRLPIKPNVPANLALGLLLGLVVGAGLVLLQEQVDDTVNDEADVIRCADAPVLAAVPAFEWHGTSAALPALTLNGKVTDAYSGLRVNLGFLTPGGRGQAVLVTSSEPGEGKTTTALNLAIVAAQSGRRVVLVDADLRHSSLRQLMGLTNVRGLSDVLAGQATVAQVARAFEGSGLSLIACGARAPNPADLLDSREMRELVEQLRREADLIILDSPPLLAAPDSLVMADLCDAVVMVCVPGATHGRALQRARGLLNQIGRRVSGVVLNKVRPAGNYGYYYDYA